MKVLRFYSDLNHLKNSLAENDLPFTKIFNLKKNFSHGLTKYLLNKL